MKVIIVGGGEPLFFLCRNFTAKGHQVVIINRDKNECVQLARQLSAVVVCGDGSDAGILKESGAMGADVILAITPNDQDNLVICQLASMKYGVPRTIALANDPDNTEIFEKLGVTSFSITQIIGSLIEQRASMDQILNLMPVGEGKVNVTEIILEADSPVVGQQLKNVDLPENTVIAVILRDNHPIVPRGGNDLQSGDRVVIITLPENHGTALKVMTGEGS